MIIKIIMICLVSGVIIQVFKSVFPQIIPVIAMCTGMVVFVMLYRYMNTALSFINNLTKNLSGLNESIKILIKTIGISIICEFASQLCSDMGEGYLSSKIDFAGKIMIFCLIMPELVNILDVITELIKKI